MKPLNHRRGRSHKDTKPTWKFTLGPCEILSRFVHFGRFQRSTAALPRHHWNTHQAQSTAPNMFLPTRCTLFLFVSVSQIQAILTEQRPVVKHVVNLAADQHMIIVHAVARTWMVKHCAQSGQKSLFTFRLVTHKEPRVHQSETSIPTEVTLAALLVLFKAPALGLEHF